MLREAGVGSPGTIPLVVAGGAADLGSPGVAGVL